MELCFWTLECEVMHLSLNHSGSHQSASDEEPLWGVKTAREITLDLWQLQKTSNISGTEEYFLIQRKTKMGTEGFSIGKEVLILFPTGFGKSFIYHLMPQVVLSYYVLWFVDLIGWISLWSMVIDRWLILSPAKRFLTMPALFQAVTKDDFSDGSV